MGGWVPVCITVSAGRAIPGFRLVMHQLAVSEPERRPLHTFLHLVIAEPGIQMSHWILENSVWVHRLEVIIQVPGKHDRTECGLRVRRDYTGEVYLNRQRDMRGRRDCWRICLRRRVGDGWRQRDRRRQCDGWCQGDRRCSCCRSGWWEESIDCWLCITVECKCQDPHQHRDEQHPPAGHDAVIAHAEKLQLPRLTQRTHARPKQGNAQHNADNECCQYSRMDIEIRHIHEARRLPGCVCCPALRFSPLLHRHQPAG